MALEQLRGGDGGAVSFREELLVLRGVAEELGLFGGTDAARRFAGSFGVKQVHSGGPSGSGSGRQLERNSSGRGGGGGGTKKKKSGAKGNKGGGNKGAVQGKSGGVGRGGTGKKDRPTAGLLEVRRTSGSPAVLVGRNNLQNDRITFSLARAHELWFHARGVAGAHVLLRLEPGQDVEDVDLAFAADVAVYFSKARQVRARGRCEGKAKPSFFFYYCCGIGVGHGPWSGFAMSRDVGGRAIFTVSGSNRFDCCVVFLGCVFCVATMLE